MKNFMLVGFFFFAIILPVLIIKYGGKIEENSNSNTEPTSGYSKTENVGVTGSKKALIEPDDVFELDIRNDKGLEKPIFVEKDSWCRYQTIPKKIPYVYIKISLTKEGLKKTEWEKTEGEDVDLGDRLSENDLYIDFKLPGTWPDPGKIKIYIKQK